MANPTFRVNFVMTKGQRSGYIDRQAATIKDAIDSALSDLEESSTRTVISIAAMMIDDGSST